MSVVSRFDLRQMGKAVKNDAGFLKCPVSATRVGVFKYFKPDGSVFKELRLPEEVFSQESMDSLKGVPFTKRHPTELVNAKNAKKYMVGFTSDLIEHDDELLKTSVTVTDAELIASIEAGSMREVSCGYTCELEMSPGMWNGDAYDAIQRNIRYNHLAAVEKGRAGPKVRLHLDSDSAIYNDSELEIELDEEVNMRRGAHEEAYDEEEELDTDEEFDDDVEDEEVEDGGPGSGPQGGGGGNKHSSAKAKQARAAKRQAALGASAVSHASFIKKGNAIKAGKQRAAANRFQSHSAKISSEARAKARMKGDDNSHSTGGIMAKIQLGGAEYEVDGGLANAIGSALKEKEDKGRRDAETSAIAEAKKISDGLQAKVDELTEANKKLEGQKTDSAEVHKLVVARASLIEKAKPLVKADTKFDEMDELGIKKAVILAKYPEMKLDEKSADYINARFDAIIEAEPVKKSTDSLKKAVSKVDDARDEEQETAEDVRKRQMKADSEAWMKPVGISAQKLSDKE